MILRNWLAHPLTRGQNIDDPNTTELRRKIISEKFFLKQIYEEWYLAIVETLPTGREPVLELGSGAGFLNSFIAGLITSEIFYCSQIDIVLDGQRLPFGNKTLRGIVMTNVLHHLPEVRHFFSEASRCVRAEGVVVMIEPWATSWSRLVYEQLHHEPFFSNAATWEFPAKGPLSGANGALAWLIFQRDRRKFEQEFPEWQILSIRPFMPFRYFVSGGVSLRSLMPGWTFNFWRTLEYLLSPWMKYLAMFVQIVLRRAD